MRKLSYDTEAEFVEACSAPHIMALPAYDRLSYVFSVPKQVSKYNPEESLKSLFHLQGTAVVATLQSTAFWLLWIFSTVLSLLYYKAFEKTSKNGVATADGWPKANASLVFIPGSLLVFGLVFYINQAYFRYHRQYMHCKGASTAMGEFILYLRTTFGDGAFIEAPAFRHHICKLLNATNVLAYAGLSGMRSAGFHFWAYQYLREQDCLTANQVEHLKKLMESQRDGRLAFKEVLNWTFRGIWFQVQKGHIRDKIATRFSNILFDMQANLDEIYSYTEGPMPFAYFHHLNFILYPYLFLLGYTFVFQGPYCTIYAYFVILLAFLSAKTLGDMLTDPFGDDELDIPVFALAHETLNESMELIARTPFKDSAPPFLLQPDGQTTKSCK